MGPIRTAGGVSVDETRTRAQSVAAASILAVLLAGCSSSSADQSGYVCPNVAIIGDLSLITRLGGEGVPPDARAFSGEIVRADSECSYGAGSVTVALQISMVYDRPVGRPAITEPVAYFVAVARPDGTVIGKDEFPATVEFRANESRAGFREELDVSVPLPQGPASGDGYTVYVGYQLSEAELQFNRQRRQ